MGFDAPSASSSTWGAPSRPSPTTSRSAAPAAAPTAPPWCCCRPRGPRHLGLLRLPGVPARGAGAPGALGARRAAGVPLHRRPRDRRRPRPLAAGDDAQGARRRRRRPPRPGRLGVHRPGLGLRQDRYARVREAREREQQAMLDYLATDRCRMWFLRDQLDDPAADRRAAAATTAAARPCSASVSEQAAEAAHERLARPGVRGRAAQDVADRPGQPRHRPQGQDRRARRRRAARWPD